MPTANITLSYTDTHAIVDAIVDDGHLIGRRYQLRVDEEGNATFFAWNWTSATWCELSGLDVDRCIGAKLADKMADKACGSPES